MQKLLEHIQLREKEHQKALRSAWASTGGAGFFFACVIVISFIGGLQDWEVIAVIFTVALFYVYLAVIFWMTARLLSKELVVLRQQASQQSGAWPSPPRDPSA